MGDRKSGQSRAGPSLSPFCSLPQFPSRAGSPKPGPCLPRKEAQQSDIRWFCLACARRPRSLAFGGSSGVKLPGVNLGSHPGAAGVGVALARGFCDVMTIHVDML